MRRAVGSIGIGPCRPPLVSVKEKVNARFHDWFDPECGRTVSNASTDFCEPAREDQTMHTFMDAKLMAKLLRQALAERNIDIPIATASNWLPGSSDWRTGTF
jgi:hypothetical protein